MKVTLSQIGESEFNVVPSWNRLIEHADARRFAILDAGLRRGPLGVAWRSDLIEPALRQSASGDRLWVGVDQMVASVDIRTERVVLLLPLNSNALDIAVRASIVVVLCETEAVAFNDDGSIRTVRTLPELPDTFIDGDDDSSVTLALSNGDVIVLR